MLMSNTGHAYGRVDGIELFEVARFCLKPFGSHYKECLIV